MAISLSCPSCRRKLKVKDELAGRRIKCPGCTEVFAVPEPEQLVDAESPAQKERAARQDLEASLGPATQDDEVAPAPKKKKKGILSMDVEELNKAFRNFDVSRFTITGWLLFAVSVAVSIAGYVVVEMNYKAIMGIPDNQQVYIKLFAPYGIAAAGGGVGCFFGGWGILYLMGVQVIRPKGDTGQES